MTEEMRELNKYEVAAMWHFHDEYADLGLGAIAYWKGLGARDKRFIRDMIERIEEAQEECDEKDSR